MEDAEYYQGSFQDDTGLAEYRSQGSEEDVDDPTKDVEVQEIDEIPDDIQLRREPQTSIPEVQVPEVPEDENEEGPGFITPRPKLSITVDAPEEQETEESPATKISQMADVVDNPYLLHYRNQSRML